MWKIRTCSDECGRAKTYSKGEKVASTSRNWGHTLYTQNDRGIVLKKHLKKK